MQGVFELGMGWVDEGTKDPNAAEVIEVQAHAFLDVFVKIAVNRQIMHTKRGAGALQDVQKLGIFLQPEDIVTHPSVARK